MPFERYLRPDDPNQTYYYQDSRHAHESDNADCHHTSGPQHLYLPESTHSDYHHPHVVQFQIPQFMLNGPPILAPGGGAEVLPAGLLDSGPGLFASSWFTNSGFAPFHSTLVSKYTSSSSTHPDSVSTTAAYHTFPPNESQSHLPTFTGCTKQALPEPSPSLDATRAYIPDLSSSPPSATSFNTTSYSLSNAPAPNLAPSLPVTPSALGLSVYSASGFDVLSILSRVVNRPNPTVQLGPVDLSCSFVIVDVRRYDSPIVYASPTFCHLTGYSEQEVLGRNCRFLQSPTGNVVKGEPRRSASPKAVSYMRKLLSSSKECQIALVNYRKGGQSFYNLVTVIPLRGGVHNTPEEADEVAYHIGFQVDLKQPNRVLDKLWDGSYCNSSWRMSSISSNAGLPGMSHGLGQLVQAQNMTNIRTKGGRHGQMMSIAVSKELRNLIADTRFTDSVPISTGTNMFGPTNASNGSGGQSNSTTIPLTMLVTPPPSSTSMNRTVTSGNTMATSIPVSLSPSLSLLLLEFLPDFLLVLSLKGAFLYVAPSVRLVLGYEPEELVGRSISDVCHPADLVPLMRELKEGSVSGLSFAGTGDVGLSMASNLVPKTVDLLFRALPKVSTSSPSSRSQEASSEQGVQSSQSLSASRSQSSLSSGTLCSNDPSDVTVPPYVWLECRGRLHVEPGKGRKAIILSGRARWMPVVRWDTIDRAGGLGSGRRRKEDTHGRSCTTTGLRLSETSPGEAAAPSINPQEFWALLSSQGTFLVASASVRDVLGWGTGEMIGRSIWAMVRDTRSGLRERVEAELSKLDLPEVRSMVDPAPTMVTTSLVHREFHVVPVRLVFYCTPRSRKHIPPSTSSIGLASTPLIHPFNNPSCPIVCQATVLSNMEYQPSNYVDASFEPKPGYGSNQMKIRTDTGNDGDESPIHRSGASLFEELETVRESSWQYELQQLKFANQRLHEELNALEASSGASAGSSSSTIGARPMESAPFNLPSLSTAPPSIPEQIPQSQQLYMSLIHSTLPTSLTLMRPPNSLHEQDPPSSEWSSLAGANGQGMNPLKRSWRSATT